VFFYLSHFRQFLQDRQLWRIDLELKRLRFHLKLKVGEVGSFGRIEALDRDPFTWNESINEKLKHLFHHDKFCFAHFSEIRHKRSKTHTFKVFDFNLIEIYFGINLMLCKPAWGVAGLWWSMFPDSWVSWRRSQSWLPASAAAEWAAGWWWGAGSGCPEVPGSESGSTCSGCSWCRLKEWGRPVENKISTKKRAKNGNSKD